MPQGAFEIVDPAPIESGHLDDYDIRPRAGLDEPIPQEQRELQKEVYRTRGILKHLEEQGMFESRGGLRRRLTFRRSEEAEPPGEQRMLVEFKLRLRQIAETGLTGDFVRVQHAAEALQDLREELLVRKGAAVKFRYLSHLAGWAAGGVLCGAGLYAVLRLPSIPWSELYGLLVIGAVVGAWLSVAATRWSVAFEDLPNFLDSKLEPLVRMLFVMALALAVGVALHAGLLKIELAGTSLAEFTKKESIALLLGLVTGVSERALATRFIESARTLAER